MNLRFTALDTVLSFTVNLMWRVALVLREVGY